MRLKIRCDGECEKFCKIFCKLNWTLVLEVLKFGTYSTNFLMAPLGSWYLSKCKDLRDIPSFKSSCGGNAILMWAEVDASKVLKSWLWITTSKLVVSVTATEKRGKRSKGLIRCKIGSSVPGVCPNNFTKHAYHSCKCLHVAVEMPIGHLHTYY